MLDQIAQAVRELFAADRSAVLRFHPDGRAQVLTMAPAMVDEFAIDPMIAPDDSTAVGRAAVTGVPQFVRYRDDATGTAAQLLAAGVRAGAAAPVFVNGELWGAISVALSDPDDTEPDTLERLGEFAELASLSISSAEAWEVLSQQAMVDPLTGLPNRRAFDRELSRALRASARTRGAVSVVIVDLDHFKRINDELGHPVGDAVLVAAAAAMASVVRAPEMLARIGGEEFGVVLEGASLVDAAVAAERLRVAIRSAPLAGVAVTASLGACSTDDPTVEPAELVTRADAALYAAKAAGRDLVRVCRQDGGPPGRKTPWT
jgi:diguanylate cyclase (GGDEF)-like protein